MIYRILFAALAVCAMASAGSAKIWWVDNVPVNDADFRTLQAANDGADEGDTIYVAGSATIYSGFTLTKRLFVFGPGYFLGQNPATQAKLAPAVVSSIDSRADAEGSLITGITMNNGITVRANNFTIK